MIVGLDKDNIGSIHGEPEEIARLLSYAQIGMRQHMVEAIAPTADQLRNQLHTLTDLNTADIDFTALRVQHNILGLKEFKDGT